MCELLNKAISRRKKIINELCAFHTQEYMITNAHWDLCQEIRDLLEVLYNATLFFSRGVLSPSNQTLNYFFGISLKLIK